MFVLRHSQRLWPVKTSATSAYNVPFSNLSMDTSNRDRREENDPFATEDCAM